MTADGVPSGTAPLLPLVVDIDGTLLRSDLLVESFSSLLASRPLAALNALLSLRNGVAAFKEAVAACSTIDLDRLPWNELMVARLDAEHAAGRPLYLASASDRRLVDRVASRFGCFAGVFASDGVTNLKAGRKADALVASFGEQGFAYAGNERADLPVWARAGEILVVNARRSLLDEVRRRWPKAASLGEDRLNPRQLIRALRPHQWTKNLLLAVPALAAHRFDLLTATTVAAAIGSFSLCASAVYVVNDLVDLDRDRQHRSKRRRPFASGALSVLTGLAMVPSLLGAAFLAALAIGPDFLLVLGGYFTLTLTYSLYLKRQMMLDVVALACLYGMRLVAGGVAADVPLSQWLAAFSIFLFCALALVKRCAELVGRRAGALDEAPGRAYRTSDLPMLESLASGAGFTSVLVFALYAESSAVTSSYHHPGRLWLLCVVLIYWIGRVLLLTHRGDMHDDPVVFAITDQTSRLAIVLAGLIVLSSL